MGNVSIVPVNPAQWIVHDGDSTATELARLPDSGAWQIRGYNTGTFPHTIYVTFFAAVIRPKAVLIIPMGLDSLQPGIGAPAAHH